jgi:hypothetical protein
MVDLSQDLAGGFVQKTWCAALVPAGDEGRILVSILQGGECVAVDGLSFDDDESDLDDVEPGPGRRAERHDDSWVRFQSHLQLRRCSRQGVSFSA